MQTEQQTELTLFRKTKGQVEARDAEQLLKLLSDGMLRTRKQIANSLSWDERAVRDAAEHSAGQIARAPGIPGYTLTRLLTVEKWQATYGNALRSVIRKLEAQLQQQQRVVYGNKPT